jgi:hypothetical protein
MKEYERDIMSDQIDNIPETECSCGELHKGHICWLSHMGLLSEMHHLSDKPTIACVKCGAKANLPHNVCFPGSL